MEELVERIFYRGEQVEKKNQRIWSWKDGKKWGGSVGMTLERNILYDYFIWNCVTTSFVRRNTNFFHCLSILSLSI